MSTYVVLLPVKPPAHGKSRLTVFSGLPDDVRRRLAEAFALDTAEACLSAASVGAVLVVTDDAGFSARLRALGCAAIPDGVAEDLNATPVAQVPVDAERTTLYTADTARFDPRFGPGSGRAHEHAGARAVGGGLASLRRDVDSVADLHDAVALGLGPRTAKVVAELGLS